MTSVKDRATLIGMRDLFDNAADAKHLEDPLADRMRPSRMEDVLGQENLLGEGKLLRRLIEADRVPSMILWGPPGTGKTTIARLVARLTKMRFVQMSAVLSGVADLRKTLEAARVARGQHGERTILFVDEIHRWSKSQQDALLDAVERGLITLIGATTENPSFELNAALLSRTRVFVLQAIDAAALVSILRRALSEGFAGLKLEVDEDALQLIANGAYGDARRALTVLDLAVRDATLLAEPGEPVRLTRDVADEAAAHKTLLYDKAGDEHYGVVSAFIKSMRGSDPDAAVYYLVRMLESGEDPRFVLRRMVIFASEDVGNADPTALQVAINALQSYEFVGMPEGVLPMTQAATYLASAPKSNTAVTSYGAALKDVRARGPLPVPKHILPGKNAMAKQQGHGKGYKYPHDLGGIAPGETYLPEPLVGRRYYEPTNNGEEATIRDRLAAWRRLGRTSQN